MNVSVVWGTDWNALREDHQREIIRRRREIFPQRPEGPVIVWDHAALGGVVVYCDGHVASFLKILRRTVKLDEDQVEAGGVSGVMTIPEYRRRGFARLALSEARRVILDVIEADMGLLLCPEDLIPFYSRCGWARLQCPVLFEQPGGRCTWHNHAMVFWREGLEREPTKADLCGLPW